jgi:hypothetical protein|tara:strand:- start:422 stop:637 length:216 start_codon:yes stop_codon:yes gene_type:complete
MIRRKLDKLTKQVESAVDNLEKMSEQLKDLQDTMIKLWRAEDMEENDGEFRYPFDKHGNLLPNTDISRRLN